MKRLFLCFLLLTFAKFIFAQQRELQASISVFPPANLSNFLLEVKYKYRPIKAPFILNAGIEYFHSDSYFEGTLKDNDYKLSFKYKQFQAKKLILPFCFNFCIGDNYKVYGGVGLYFGVNFHQKTTPYYQTTLFQLGSYYNAGFQFKIRERFFLNVESKLLHDLTPSYKIPISSSHWGYYVGLESISVGYCYINLGGSYRLTKKKVS